MNIEHEKLGDVWLAYMQAVLQAHHKIPDDREPVFESDPITVRVATISQDDPIIRRFADPHVISIYTEKMFSMEVIPELNSTYGDRIFNNNNINQFDWLAKRLASKWWSKGAAISLLKPNDPGPRIPCLTQIQYTIRNGQLYLYTVFRSQNVFRSYGNFFGLHALHKKMARRLSIKMGSIVSYCICPHLYESDVSKVRAILAQTGRAFLEQQRRPRRELAHTDDQS